MVINTPSAALSEANRRRDRMNNSSSGNPSSSEGASDPIYGVPLEPRTADGRSIYSLLASAWFYGGWKAETHAEQEMQSLMEARGFWPIPGEGALMTMIGRDLFEGEALAKMVKS